MKIPLRLSCNDLNGRPAILSLWYEYRNRHLYCATQLSAKVVQYLRNDPRCAFEISVNEPPYVGLRGQGRITLDEDQGEKVLESLIIRYLGSLEVPLAKKLLAKSDHEVALVIEPIWWSSWDFSARMNDSL
jgi:hypothetical protein